MVRIEVSPMFELSPHDRQALTSFLQHMVRTPSFSCQEKEVADRLAAEMHAVGFDHVWTDRIGNVVGRVGRGTGPCLLFNAHMDTVGVGDPAAWTHDPFGAEIVNGDLFGRGAADMKGPLASLVYGIKALKESGVELAGDVYVVGVVQEEPCEGYAMRVLVEEERVRPDWVVLAEPSDLKVSRGQRGRMEMQVTVQGRSCHASMPDYGENAIYGAARIIFSLELLSDMLAEDAFLGKGTLAVTHIENTAASKNVIPDSCTFVIDRRLTLGETEAKALAEVEGVIAREGMRAKVHLAEFDYTSYTGYRCQEKEHYPAWVTPEAHTLVQATVKVVREVTGERPAIGKWDFSTDGVYTMGVAGIPTVGLGPGEETQAHTADEHICLTDCYTAAQIYAHLAVEMLGQA
jgi:putative selenium metabolism hydrolase